MLALHGPLLGDVQLGVLAWGPCWHNWSSVRAEAVEKCEPTSCWTRMKVDKKKKNNKREATPIWCNEIRWTQWTQVGWGGWDPLKKNLLIKTLMWERVNRKIKIVWQRVWRTGDSCRAGSMTKFIAPSCRAKCRINTHTGAQHAIMNARFPAFQGCNPTRHRTGQTFAHGKSLPDPLTHLRLHVLHVEQPSGIL